MEYITAEEFLKQPKEVQESLNKYAFNGRDEYDLFVETGSYALNKQHKWFSKPTFRYELELNKNLNGKFVPLLTEGQLRGFIQDKTDCYVEILHSKERKIGVTLVNKESISPEKLIPTEEQNVLQAYWEVACKIAKEDDLNAGTM